MMTPTQRDLSDQIAKLLSQLRQAQYWLTIDRDPDGIAEARKMVGELQAELDRLMMVVTRVA
jgi:hypothetical protein